MYVRLRHQFATDNEVEIEVGNYDGPAYPDELAEALARVVELYEKVLAE